MQHMQKKWRHQGGETELWVHSIKAGASQTEIFVQEKTQPQMHPPWARKLKADRSEATMLEYTKDSKSPCLYDTSGVLKELKSK